MLIIIAIALTILLALVIYFDVTNFIIPNWLNFTFIALWPIFLLATPEPIEWWWSLAVMAGFFAVGMLIFALNIMGGGDVKLLIALSLWIGWQPQSLLIFGFWVAIAGGVLAAILLIARLGLRQSVGEKKVKKEFPKIFQMKSPIPYGVAIAYSFGYMIWTNQILGLIIDL